MSCGGGGDGGGARSIACLLPAALPWFSHLGRMRS